VPPGRPAVTAKDLRRDGCTAAGSLHAAMVMSSCKHVELL
jgi:hypothetical protein